MAVLRSDAPLFEKAKACQRLSVVGTKACVPALAALLGDPELAHYARFGLEPIPDPAVDEALRRASTRLEGGRLVGVILSIAARRDAAAAGILSGLLSSPDAEVAAAAAGALGRIGTSEAASVLLGELDRAGADRRAAVAEGALLCAEAARARGDSAAAAVLHDAVRAAEVPPRLRLEATRGAILARGSVGIPLLIETLRAAEFADFALALGVARELPGAEVTLSIVRASEGLPPERRALLLDAIAERGGPEALAAALEAAGSESAAVRGAAVGALGKLGDPAALPALLGAAAAGDPEIARAAVDAIVALRGDDVDGAVLAALSRSEGKAQVVAMEVAGRRRLIEALPAIRKSAVEGEEAVRIAAIGALGEAMGADDVAFLAERLVAADSEAEAEAIVKALQAASRRAPDRDAWAEAVIGGEGTAGRETETGTETGTGTEIEIRVLRALWAIGGPRAAGAVAERARGGDPAVRKAAIEVLGTWLDEAGPRVLLDLVKATADAEERLAALGAWCDRVRNLRFPKEARLALCREALVEVARGADEKKVAIFACRGIPAVETMDLVLPYLEDPEISEEVCAALVGMSQRVIRFQPEAVARAMERVLETSRDEGTRATASQLLRNAGGES